MKEIKGDLIKLAKAGEFDVIVHGCNCFHIMGAGIAKQIKYNFPAAYDIDKTTKKGDPEKLGDISYISIHKNYYENDLIIVNAYTQYNLGRDVKYRAIESAFTKINRIFGKLRIGIPYIGAGIAGGDWNRIKSIIDKVCPNVTVVKYERG